MHYLLILLVCLVFVLLTFLLWTLMNSSSTFVPWLIDVLIVINLCCLSDWVKMVIHNTHFIHFYTLCWTNSCNICSPEDRFWGVVVDSYLHDEKILSSDISTHLNDFGVMCSVSMHLNHLICSCGTYSHD